MSPDVQPRRDVIREIGVFVAAYRLDTVKLLTEIQANWPDATGAEVEAAVAAAGQFFRGGDDE